MSRRSDRRAAKKAGEITFDVNAFVDDEEASEDVKPVSSASGFAGADDVSDSVLRELSDAFGDSGTSDAATAAATGATSDRPRVVIATDDLPDAVYVESDDRGGRHILIEDDSMDMPVPDGSGGLSTATSSGVDPRMRARRIAVRREEGRKRLRLALIFGGVLVVVLGTLAVLGSPLFAIDTVDVEGATYSDPDAVAEIVDGLVGEPILTADLRGAQADLEALVWVRRARVTMDFPHRVLIEVDERKPLAYFQGDDEAFRVIDIDGIVLAVIDGKPVDYVAITGTGPDLASGADSGGAYRGAALLANALPPALRPRVTSLGVTDSGELTLLLDGGATADGTAAPSIEVVFGQPDDYQEKLVALLNELERHEPGEVSRIDVSTGSPIIG